MEECDLQVLSLLLGADPTWTYRGARDGAGEPHGPGAWRSGGLRVEGAFDHGVWHGRFALRAAGEVVQRAAFAAGLRTGFAESVDDSGGRTVVAANRYGDLTGRGASPKPPIHRSERVQKND